MRYKIGDFIFDFKRVCHSHRISFLLITSGRGSHQRCSVKKGFLKNFIKFTGKHLCQSLFLIKLQASGLQLFKKKKLWHRCFPVNFAKFLGTPFYRTPPDDCFYIEVFGALSNIYDKTFFCKNSKRLKSLRS